MGFWDKLLSGLGFEGSSEPSKEKKKKDKNIYTSAGAEFQLKNAEQNTTNEEKSVISGLTVQIPKTQKEVQNIIDEVEYGKAVIVNLTGFNATDRIRALDFMAGACYALKAKIQTLEGNLYLINK